MTQTEISITPEDALTLRGYSLNHDAQSLAGLTEGNAHGGCIECGAGGSLTADGMKGELVEQECVSSRLIWTEDAKGEPFDEVMLALQESYDNKDYEGEETYFWVLVLRAKGCHGIYMRTNLRFPQGFIIGESKLYPVELRAIQCRLIIGLK